MKKQHFIDVVNSTLTIEPEDEQGKSFDEGVLFVLDALCEQEEGVTRCKECLHNKVCFMAPNLGPDGFCSFGAK